MKRFLAPLLYGSLLMVARLSAADLSGLQVPRTADEEKACDAVGVQVADDVAQGDFVHAFQKADALIAKYPDAPQGWVLSVFARALYINYYRTKTLKNVLLDHARKVEETVAVLQKRGSTDPKLNFYLGGALGYRGLLEMQEGRYLTSLGTALKAVDALEPTVRANPPVYDAYFGLAIFYFSRFYYARLLSFISASQDDRTKAYQYLEIAQAKGTTMRHEALFRSFVFAMNDRAWDGLEARMQKARKDYPGNLYLRYRLLEYYTIREQWEQVLPLGKETAAIFSNDGQAGPTVQYWVWAYLALAHAQLGHRAEAEAALARLDLLQPALEAWNDNPKMQDRARKAREILRVRKN